MHFRTLAFAQAQVSSETKLAYLHLSIVEYNSRCKLFIVRLFRVTRVIGDPIIAPGTRIEIRARLPDNLYYNGKTKVNL